MGVRTVLQKSTLKSLSLALQARTNDPTVTVIEASVDEDGNIRGTYRFHDPDQKSDTFTWTMVGVEAVLAAPLMPFAIPSPPVGPVRAPHPTAERVVRAILRSPDAETVADDVVRLLSDRPRVQPTTSEG